MVRAGSPSRFSFVMDVYYVDVSHCPILMVSLLKTTPKINPIE